MRKVLALLVTMMLLCFANACATLRPPRVTHVVAQVRMEVHADTSFTPRERALIMKGVNTMREQTSGFLDYTVVFDLDFNSMASLKEHTGHNTLTRVHSSAGELEKDTIGYCYVNFDDLNFDNPTKAALVYDRLPTDEVWIHVAMHEMMHMVRLHHIPYTKSIMYKSTPQWGTGIVTCMVQEDVQELCTVHGCDLIAMKPCKP